MNDDSLPAGGPSISWPARVHAQLEGRGERLVLAESCTGGALAAVLTEIAGATAILCGSAVTYREATKTAWLELDPDLIEAHTAVSAEVTREMALAVLRHTPEATWALANTGHLGPQAPPEFDGRLFLGLALRQEERIAMFAHEDFRLAAADRASRRREAVTVALEWLSNILAEAA